MSDETCWLCDSDLIVYTDVLDLKWCCFCYEDIYLGGASDPD